MAAHPRILIFGTGSIGAIYMYLLSRTIPATTNIVAVCRSNYDAASKHGFTIHSDSWGQNLSVKPRVIRSVEDDDGGQTKEEGEGFDFILVTAKAIPGLADKITPAVTPGRTTIALLQNGIGIEDEYRRLFPNNPLISGVVYLPATQIAPAVMRQAPDVQNLHLGTFPASAPQAHKDRVVQLSELLRAGGADVQVHEDIQEERWSKLLVNAPWNPICALTRCWDLQFLASSSSSPSPGSTSSPPATSDQGEAEELVRDVMGEVVSVARAHGYANIDESVIEKQLARVKDRQWPGVQPSMLADALGGNGGMEVDAIVGNLLRMARDKGVQTPCLRVIHLLLRGLEYSFKARREKEGRSQ
jgi:2-dehydropantoate 2-reductase